MNGPKSFQMHNKPTFGLVLDRFETEERLETIVKQPTGILHHYGADSHGATAAGYRSYIRTHVRPKWAELSLRK